MVRGVQPIREAEALIIGLEDAERQGKHGFVADRMKNLEQAITFLMELNYRLAGNEAANALAAPLQYRARLLQDRHRIHQKEREGSSDGLSGEEP